MDKKKIGKIAMFIFIAVLLFSAGFVTSLTLKQKREVFYQQFGPRLNEAIILVLTEEINILRTNAGLTPRTTEQVVDAITSKLETIENYDLMNIP